MKVINLINKEEVKFVSISICKEFLEGGLNQKEITDNTIFTDYLKRDVRTFKIENFNDVTTMIEMKLDFTDKERIEYKNLATSDEYISILIFIGK